MKGKKAKPQKATGYMDLAGKKFKIGSLEPVPSEIKADPIKAIKLIAKKEIFQLPREYING